MSKLERTEQTQFVNEVRKEYPDLLLRVHLDGMRFANERDKKYVRTAQHNTQNYPDLFIPNPVWSSLTDNCWHGLFIEFKTSRSKYATLKNELRKDEKLEGQKACMVRLRKQGYYCDFAGAEEAMDLLKWYLNLDGLYMPFSDHWWPGSILKDEGFLL